MCFWWIDLSFFALLSHESGNLTNYRIQQIINKLIVLSVALRKLHLPMIANRTCMKHQQCVGVIMVTIFATDYKSLPKIINLV